MQSHRIPPFSRRTFVQRGALFALGFSGLRRLVQNGLAASDREPATALEEDFYGTFDLPQGFNYKVISEVGERMEDGLLVPGKHDGMGAFAGPNGLTLAITGPWDTLR
jgi:secreted PhoX family phosphatase